MKSAGPRRRRQSAADDTAKPLTQRRLKALEPRSTRYIVWDSRIPGFGVRVGPRAKTFILVYRLPSGRVRRATIGRVGVVALEQARLRARRHIGVVADGKDPLRPSDLAREAPTVGDVADRFLKEHVNARRKTSTQRLYKLAIDGHIRPRFGATAILDVTTADVMRLHHGLRATPVMANRVLAVESKLFNWAEQQGYRPKHSNPCRGIEKYREQARRRYLTIDEMVRLGAALRIGERFHRMSPTAITVIRLLLLTGARVSEILALRWREVDLAHGLLQLPDSKTGRKTIVLNPPALVLLKAQHLARGHVPAAKTGRTTIALNPPAALETSPKARPSGTESPYVFPGEGREWRRGQHRVSLWDAWSRIRRLARIPDVRLHDLRHSFASVAASGGQTLPVIGALLGHSQAATTQRYAHLMDNPLRAASQSTGATIAAAMAPRRVR